MLYILLLMIINIVFHIICVEEATTLINKDFFADIVGMDELAFRAWLSSPKNPKLSDWIKEYPRREAIFSFDPVTVTAVTGKKKVNMGESIAEIDKFIKDNKPNPLTDKPIFLIQFFDPFKEQDSDIRWLQANPQLKDAVFQIASNFNTLEGGMGVKNALLTNMLNSPVQGELASISAAPATILRKYFMDPFNLLYRLGKNGIEMKEEDGFANPTEQTLQKILDGSINVNEIDYKDIAICEQQAVITSGYGGVKPDDEVKRLAVALKSDGKVDEAKTQIVYQIFTAALDMRNFTGPLNSNLKDFAKLIIKGSYEGTIKDACGAGVPRIFLTIMGGGSFRNDIAWIAEALEGLEGFIKDKGMQVVLMYRPDKPRDFPVRTVDGDIDFLKRMVILANKINNTTHNLDDIIKNYVTKAYAKESYSTEAQQLQAQFPLNYFYTPTPPKIPSIPSTTVPPTTTPVTPLSSTGMPAIIITPLGKFTKALQTIDVMLKKGKPAEKIEPSVVKVNDTTYKVGSKTIQLIVGDITAQKNIDVLVNAANVDVTTVGSGGIAGAISRKMAPDETTVFAEDIKTRYGKKLKKGRVGGAYLGKLKNGSFLNNLGYKYLINAVGPICPSENVNLVADAYSNSLQEAAKVGATSIVMPRISAIIFNCPANIIDPLAVETVVKYLSENQDSSLQTVYLIFYPGQPLDMTALEKYKELLNKKLKK